MSPICWRGERRAEADRTSPAQCRSRLQRVYVGRARGDSGCCWLRVRRRVHRPAIRQVQGCAVASVARGDPLKAMARAVLVRGPGMPHRVALVGEPGPEKVKIEHDRSLPSSVRVQTPHTSLRARSDPSSRAGGARTALDGPRPVLPAFEVIDRLHVRVASTRDPTRRTWLAGFVTGKPVSSTHMQRGSR